MAPRTEVAVDLVTRLKDKGFKDLKKQSKSTEEQLASLGKKLAGFFSVAAIAQFSKQSIKAFLSDEKAAKSLTRTLGNLGLAFQDKGVKLFISDLEKTSGVVDDQLRPAFSSLLTTTRSVAKSQELLTLALDVSAGSGEAVTQVANDLARAYVGSTKGLKKYNLGLTDAQLKSKSFAEIQALLNKQFAGQNVSRLDTYQGKVDILSVAFANLQENVGKSLVDALSNAAGPNGVQGLADQIELTSRKIGNLIGFIDLLSTKLRNIPVVGKNLPGIFDPANLPVIGAYIDLIDKYMEAQKIKLPEFNFNSPSQNRQFLAAYKKQLADERAANAERLRKERAVQAEKKRTAEIERLKSAIQFRFDIDAINLQAALRRNISASDRERVLQLSALKISDYQTDAEAIKTLQAATQGRYDDAMNLEKMLQLLTTAGFANSKAAIDALAAMKPDIKFTDNLDSVISRLKALIEGKYSVNIGVNTGGLGTTTGIGGTTITSKGTTPTITGPNPAITNIGKRVGDTLDAIDEAFFGSIQSPAATSVGPNPAISNIAKRVGDTLDTIDTALLNPVVTPAAVAANPAISNLSKRVGDTVDFGMGAQAASPTVIVNVTVEGSLLSQQDLVSAVTDAVYETQRTGNPILIAV